MSKPWYDVYLKLVDYYKESMHDMKNRAPGKTTIFNVEKLTRRPTNGYRLPFNPWYNPQQPFNPYSSEKCIFIVFSNILVILNITDGLGFQNIE